VEEGSGVCEVAAVAVAAAVKKSSPALWSAKRAKRKVIR
jgi:hypothetical protein